MYKLEPTKAFEKGLKKLSGKEQQAVANKLKILAENPFHPSLRTKKVQKLKNVFESSVNMESGFCGCTKATGLSCLLKQGIMTYFLESKNKSPSVSAGILRIIILLSAFLQIAFLPQLNLNCNPYP